jgi:hypothetical protein
MYTDFIDYTDRNEGTRPSVSVVMPAVEVITDMQRLSALQRAYWMGYRRAKAQMRCELDDSSLCLKGDVRFERHNFLPSPVEDNRRQRGDYCVTPHPGLRDIFCTTSVNGP